MKSERRETKRGGRGDWKTTEGRAVRLKPDAFSPPLLKLGTNVLPARKRLEVAAGKRGGGRSGVAWVRSGWQTSQQAGHGGSPAPPPLPRPLPPCPQGPSPVAAVAGHAALRRRLALRRLVIVEQVVYVADVTAVEDACGRGGGSGGACEGASTSEREPHAVQEKGPGHARAGVQGFKAHRWA